MAKSLSSDNIRLPNDLIQPVKKLNDIFRSGQQKEVLTGLNTLIAALDRGEAIATYNGIDAKLQIIVETLNQLQHKPLDHIASSGNMMDARAAEPAGQVQEQRPIAPTQMQVARATAPAAPTVMIYLSSEGYGSNIFKTPVGEHYVKCGVWDEIPLSWLPMIQDQVQKSNHYNRSGFRLEVAG
jgi:hypothetical protein